MGLLLVKGIFAVSTLYLLLKPNSVMRNTPMVYRKLSIEISTPVHRARRTGALLKLMMPFRPWSIMCRRWLRETPYLRARQVYGTPTAR